MGTGEQSSCLLALANVCQVLAGMAQDWLVPPDEAVIVGAFLSLPLCRPAIEELGTQCVLRDFLRKLQRVIHANFHARVSAACGDSSIDALSWPPGASVVHVLRAWSSHCRADFHRRHHPVDIVKALIVGRLASPPTTVALGRHVGMSRRALERAFLERTRETIVAFRTRERVLRLDRLVQDGTKFDAAARIVGWKSPKDAYRAYTRQFGRMPRARGAAA